MENRDLPPESRQKTRFLVDEGLGVDVAAYLRACGYNAVFAGDVGLLGRSDEEVFAYAWRKRRVVLTHDHDFIDDAKFPEHRNPGVIVLAGGSGDHKAMETAVGVLMNVFGHGHGLWEKSKISISAEGYITARVRDRETGKISTMRFRLRSRQYELLEEGA